MTNHRERLTLTRAERERFGRLRTLTQLQALDPIAFERYCGYLYQKRGYTVYTTATSGDEGVDLYLRQGRRSVVVQCKRYQGTVGQPLVRDLYGTMLHNKADEAALVTTGRFSRAAETWVEGKPIELVDRHALMNWARRERLGGGGRRLALPAILLLAVSLSITLLFAGRTIRRRRAAAPTATPAAIVIPTTPAETPAPEPTPTVAPTAPATATAPSEPTATPSPAATATRLPTLTPTPVPVPMGAVAALPAEGIVVDGGHDEWPAGPVTETLFLVQAAESAPTTPDAASSWRLAWDDTALYVAVTVVDDRLVQERTDRLIFRGDSVALLLDLSSADDGNALLSADDVQLVLSPGDFDAVPPTVGLFRGNENGALIGEASDAVALAALRSAGGYTLEARIPWDTLGVKPAPALTLGLTVVLSDNDTPRSLVQQHVLANAADATQFDPTSWGRLFLQP